jgi:DegV family protein with EDD domain
MTVKIVTDSAAALPADLAATHAISVVPMWLNVDGEAIHEGDIPLAELLARGDVKTSGPTPGEFEAAARNVLGDDGVVVCTIASTMSATYEAAVLGARAIGPAVRVFDTGTAAGAQALVALAAAEAAEQGLPADEVVDVAARAASEVRLVATLPGLEHLVRSGRVPNIAGRAGRLLGIAPMFEFRNGRAHALRPALGMSAARDRVAGAVGRDHPLRARLHVTALHADAEAEARALLAQMVERHNPVTAFIASFGTVMTVHTGPGLVGLAWRWEPESES